MRPTRLAPFLIPVAILLGESVVLGQPDTNLVVGVALLAAVAVGFWGMTSLLQHG